MRDSEKISIRGLSYHIHHAGPAAGPVVFLLHGLLDSGASFAPLAEQLPGLRLIAPDWRGHGDSDYAPQGYWFPDYVADLDALVAHYAGAAPVVLVGHSMGGQVAALYAGLRPTRVRRLICLDSLNLPATPAEEMPKRYRGWLDAQITPPTPRSYADVGELAQRIRRRYPELAAAQIEALAAAWSRPAGDGRIRLANDPLHRVPFPYGFHPQDTMAIWRQVRAPTLCLDGGASPAKRWIEEGEMAQRRACFADLSHQVIAGAGHMLHLERPGEVAAWIAAFEKKGGRPRL